jgi:diguanylate cyclase
MPHPDDIEHCRSCAERALALMMEHAISPTPENYALWFSYAAGDNPAVMDAIDQGIAGGGLTQDDCARLYEQNFSNRATEQAMMELGDSVSQEITKVQNLLETASRDTKTYGSTLEGVSGQLAKVPQDPPLMKVVIDNLVAATRTMATRSQRLEQSLEKSNAEVKKLQANIEAARTEARTDGLTQLANRLAFDEAFERAIQTAEAKRQSLSIIMGDIDHFKTFNDTWGHQTGDQVLRLVAHCMCESVRERDVPARYGGEEFAVIALGANLDTAVQIAERIRASVESKRVMKRSTGEDLGSISMSLGVAIHRPGEPGGDLVKRADASLYAAKRAGRNRVVSERDCDDGAATREPRAAAS